MGKTKKNKVELVVKAVKSLSDLNPAPYNPRIDLKPGDPDYEKLKKSIVSWGQVQDIVWNETTGNIVGGHQTYKVLKELGYTECNVSVVNLTTTAEAALNLALNKIKGDWDFSLLKDLITTIDTGEFDIGITGFDQEELDFMFGYDSGFGDPDPPGGNDSPVLKITVPGGVWFDSKDKIVEQLEAICNDYGLKIDVPSEPKGQKKQRF